VASVVVVVALVAAMMVVVGAASVLLLVVVMVLHTSCHQARNTSTAGSSCRPTALDRLDW
jgi:hypothetical protein